jgi:hypothetical protein
VTHLENLGIYKYIWEILLIFIFKKLYGRVWNGLFWLKIEVSGSYNVGDKLLLKIKFTLEQSMKAQRGSTSITLLFL